MTLKDKIWNNLPVDLKNPIRLRREGKRLQRVGSLDCNTKPLRLSNTIDLSELFDSDKLGIIWIDAVQRLDPLAIPDGTGGTNLGDRRAIYYLISSLKPSTVLEVGTHIGASTIHIADALHVGRIRSGGSAELVSVDVSDVNDIKSKPWLAYGAKHSPAELVTAMGFDSFVEFVIGTSLTYLGREQRKFDFIFLDGDHRAQTVYQEIPAALRSLNENGVILLHDYYPGLKPLWPDGLVIPGPYLATKRLKQEGADITVLPLGELPWPTKLESNVSSLALVMRGN
ncbi:MAG: class I SAM-dependent methyltransferase [Candidatus Latescibacterota bacterium]|nr:MAG: class I SAM-dependent methyltransferase [Candidatus Latescibacterota bacterium]